jgi:hypothetical protein
MTMFALLAVTLLPSATPEVKVVTLDGKSATGWLIAVADDTLTLRQGSRDQSFNTTDLESVSGGGASSIPPGVQITLHDGSIIAAESAAARQGKASLSLSGGAALNVNLKQLASVRWPSKATDLDRQWNDYAAESVVTDRLVVRRKAEDGGLSLDVMEGTVLEVSDATINFDLAGEAVKVKRERVEGILFARPREAIPSAAPTCVVSDRSGSRWSARNVSLAEERLKIVTTTGIATEVKLDDLVKLDYSVGNRRLLVDLPRESVVRETWIASDAKTREQSFQPLVGRTPEGKIAVGGQPWPNGLWLPAKTSLIVRVPAGFTRLQANIGVDDRVGATDGAQLKIDAEGRVLFDQLMTRETMPIDVDLGDARRVRITVTYGGESFLGDQLVLGDARFTR